MGRGAIRRVLTATFVAAAAFGAAAGARADLRLGEVVRLNDEGRFAEAERTARLLLAEVEKESGTDSLETAQVLDVLVYALRRGGKEAMPETMAAAQRALDIRERRLGPDDPDVAESLIKIGNLHLLNARVDDALDCYRRALPIQESAFGPESGPVAGTLGNLGNAAADKGDLPQARRYYERALELSRRFGSPHWTALTASSLGTILEEMADFQGAIDLYREALSIIVPASGPEHADVAIVVDNLAGALEEMGDLRSARELRERALRIREKTLGADHRLTGGSLMNLGNTFRKMGKPAEAKPYLVRALHVIETRRDHGHPLVAMALHALADAEIDLGELAAARPLASRALGIREARFGPDHPRVAESLVQLSRLDAAEGRRSAALDRALRAASIVRQAVARAAPVLSEKDALNLGTTLSSGLDAAIDALGSGRETIASRDAERVWDAIILSRAIVLDEMARRHRAILDSDRPVVARLAAGLEASRGRLARLLVSGHRAGGGEAGSKLLREALEEVERSERALAEASAAYRDERERAGGDLAGVLDALPAGSAIAAYFVSGDRYMAFVAASGRAGVRRVDLGPRANIDRMIDAWQARASAAPERAADLDAYRRAGSALRRAVWDPLAAAIGDATLVFIVPDGGLHQVSFATLPAGSDRYLVEEAPALHYLSAERDLVSARRLPPPSAAHRAAGGLLVLGGPDFDDVSRQTAEAPGAFRDTADRTPGPDRGALSDCRSLRSLRFAPLPGSLAEADEISALWRRANVDEAPSSAAVIELTSRAAGEAALKASAAGHAVIHLATHAFWMQGPCSGSGAGPETRTGVAGAPGVAVPARTLLLSGLALAGANQRGEDSGRAPREDGILTADEAAGLDLRGVEWVVLSACQSGLGPVRRGEGVLGLRRAFQIAGSGALILTLWPVSDQDTRDWMRELYTARLGGADTASAMRTASARILKARRGAHVSTHPFFWGAFVAAGDWR